jgi:hypothetical protein
MVVCWGEYGTETGDVFVDTLGAGDEDGRPLR